MVFSGPSMTSSTSTLAAVLLHGDGGRAEADGVAVARHARGRGEFVSLELPGDKDRPGLQRGCQQQESGRQQQSRKRSEAWLASSSISLAFGLRGRCPRFQALSQKMAYGRAFHGMAASSTRYRTREVLYQLDEGRPGTG